MARKFNRRTVLELLGLSSVGAMLPWLHTRQARSGPEDVPLRVLFVECGAGARRGTWEPTVPGPVDPLSTEVITDWAFRSPMASLAAYQPRINLFANLDMVSVREDPTGAANAHTDGGTHYMVAGDRLSSELAGSQSIDQLIAEKLNEDQLLTKLRSLEIKASEESGYYSQISHEHRYAVPGEKLPFIQHIPTIWDHIFPDPLDENVEAQQQRVARKTSAYNYVKGDYERLIQQLGTEDRAKIQSMLDHRTDLQAALTLFNDRAANRPDQAEVMAPYMTIDDGAEGSLDNRKWQVKVPIVNKMMGAALHTDTTRVGNLIIDRPPDYEYGYVAGNEYQGIATTDWHDLTHKVSGDNPEITDPLARQHNDEWEQQNYAQLAALLAELDSLPETDGLTMLDHTLLVVVSHIGEGSHDVTRLPWMTIGDAQGALLTGRYVRFPIAHMNDVNDIGQLQYPDEASHRVWTYRGRPHNDLFTTIAQAMGVNIAGFGKSLAHSKGPIT
ncbi:MAG: DUF1552 domain-containing protein, partial [Myxococcales bacterium]|nr:DUF1552 domain-containing protein [Myxococcales bacterium]